MKEGITTSTIASRHPTMIRPNACVHLFIAALALLAAPASAQTPFFAPQQEAVTLTLDEAIQIALLNNYAIRNSRMDVADALAQIRGGWGAVLPQIEASSGYTRNLMTANPFAGSAAGDLFSGFAFLGWLAYNEDARTDDDPTTIPITFKEFDRRQTRGLEDADIVLGGSDNPFAVENQFQNSINITQTIFDPRHLMYIKGLKRLSQALELAVDRQEQLVVNQVRQAFYQTLLAQEQAHVASLSVSRTQRSRNEMARRVALGVAPKAQRLSADVQLANLQTQLVESENRADAALDNLKFILGIPVDQAVRLRGDLTVDGLFPYVSIAAGDAFAQAVQRRPDLEQAQLQYELSHMDMRATKSDRLPKLSAFANVSYTGSVPDNRSYTIDDDDDPFKYSAGQNDFFSTAYWQPSINVGFSLRWTIFDGFQRAARVQQLRIVEDRAQLGITQLRQTVRLEVETALRNLKAAQQQIISQETNVANAQLNYSYAHARLAEGVATPLEERDASNQLDQSRINYLQAVYSYLIAHSAYETAIGVPLGRQGDLRLTSYLAQ